jgi:hypothetical protein
VNLFIQKVVCRVNVIGVNVYNNYYVYELCSSATPWLPFYIGKGKGNRMYIHKRTALKGNHKNKHLQRKILKILKEGNDIYYHKFNDNVSEEDAFSCEITAIATFRGAKIKLCNHTSGGDGLKNPSKEVRKKISEGGKGRIPWHKGKTGVYSEKRLNEISLQRKGCITSIETREKISKGNKGKHAGPNTVEWINKLKIAKRPPVTDESRKNRSINGKGKHLGPFSKEHKENLSKAIKIWWSNKK